MPRFAHDTQHPIALENLTVRIVGLTGQYMNFFPARNQSLNELVDPEGLRPKVLGNYEYAHAYHLTSLRDLSRS
jgi:hypothetical protein